MPLRCSAEPTDGWMSAAYHLRPVKIPLAMIAGYALIAERARPCWHRGGELYFADAHPAFNVLEVCNGRLEHDVIR